MAKGKRGGYEYYVASSKPAAKVLGAEAAATAFKIEVRFVGGLTPTQKNAFTTAVALTRDMSNPLVYDAETIRDPLVRDLARRIELEPVAGTAHEAPGVWPAEILIDCAGQHHVLSTRPHKGSPTNPFTWDDACEKFRRYTASVISAQRAATIIDAVGGLDQATDIAKIVTVVAGR